MLLKTIVPKRWFIWTLVLMVVVGLGLFGYLQWVNLQIDAESFLQMASV